MDKDRLRSIWFAGVATALAVFSNSFLTFYAVRSDRQTADDNSAPFFFQSLGRFFEDADFRWLTPFLISWFFVFIGASIISALNHLKRRVKLKKKGLDSSYDPLELGIILIVSFLATLVSFPGNMGQPIGFGLIYGSILNGAGMAAIVSVVTAK